jgi:hypothetical protein
LGQFNRPCEYLETSRAFTHAAHEALGGAHGTRPLVVDPFAGGGSIPLEALRVGEHDILTHAGKISHEVAVTKAEIEFESYQQKKLNEPSAIEKDFEKAISKIERLKLKAPGKPKKK